MLWIAIVSVVFAVCAIVVAVWQVFRRQRELSYSRFIEYENACLRAELRSVCPNHPKLGSDGK